ncbi:MAG: NPCBM/NEW2 domain-containing protein [Bacillota bacterium]
MKNKFTILAILLVGIFLGNLFNTTAIFGETTQVKKEVYFNSKIKYMFDRVEKANEKPTIFYDGKIYVPIDFLTSNMGKDYLYNNEEEIIYIGKKPGDESRSLTGMKEQSQNAVSINVTETLFDSKKYENGIAFMQNRSDIRYYLNDKKYLSLTATVGPIVSYMNSDRSYLIFYGNGREIYRTPEFVARNGTYLSQPMKIKIPIENITNLKIEMVGTTRIGLMDVKVWY